MSQPDYGAFVADFHAHFTRDANRCVELGVAKHLGELPDPSLDAVRHTVSEARTLLGRADSLRQTAGASLAFDDALDLELAALMLEAEICDATYTWNGRTTRQQKPSAGDDISNGIFALFINDPRPAGERLENITSRIEKVPDYLEALAGRLDTPVARWVDIELDKIAGLPSLFDNVCELAEHEQWADSVRLDRAGLRAKEALHHYAARLRAMPTTTQLHIGEKNAERLVRLRGIPLALSDLHRIACKFLAETRALIAELQHRLIAKYRLDPDTSTAALQRYLAERYQVAPPGSDLDTIIERYQRERDHLSEFLRARDLFPIPAMQDMKILRTPSFFEPSISAGAMQPPAPFREGVRTSLVYLTLSESLRAEHTEISIPGMMIHEGIPGHHLQLATASMHRSVIRRHVNASEHAEGWTTMLEDYMLDIGYVGELTDEARFVGKRDLSRIGARVAIDLFFMTGDRSFLDVGVDCDLSAEDPFVAAGNLLTQVTGFVPGRVQAELNWYSQERAYPLSYLTGYHLVWQLKRDVAAHSGLAGMELDRTFHRVYLESGNMPVSFLRRVFAEAGLLPPSPKA